MHKFEFSKNVIFRRSAGIENLIFFFTVLKAFEKEG